VSIPGRQRPWWTPLVAVLPVAAPILGAFALASPLTRLFLPPVLGFLFAIAWAVVAVRARHWPGLALVVILWSLTFLVWFGWAVMYSLGHGTWAG
jgi:hypothetical protein